MKFGVIPILLVIVTTMAMSLELFDFFSYEWQIDAQLLLETSQADLVNEGGDPLQGGGGFGEVPRGAAVQVSEPQVVNLVQLSL